DAIVDSLAPRSPGAALAVPGSDVGRAELELERCGHAVQRVEPICLRRLSVRVQVDEARGDHEAVRVYRIPAAYGLRCDDGDSSVDEPDVEDRIELGGRVHHVSTENRAVVDGRRA